MSIFLIYIYIYNLSYWIVASCSCSVEAFWPKKKIRWSEASLKRSTLAVKIDWWQICLEATLALGWIRSLQGLKMDAKNIAIVGVKIDRFFLPIKLALFSLKSTANFRNRLITDLSCLEATVVLEWIWSLLVLKMDAKKCYCWCKTGLVFSLHNNAGVFWFHDDFMLSLSSTFSSKVVLWFLIWKCFSLFLKLCFFLSLNTEFSV